MPRHKFLAVQCHYDNQVLHLPGLGTNTCVLYLTQLKSMHLYFFLLLKQICMFVFRNCISDTDEYFLCSFSSFYVYKP